MQAGVRGLGMKAENIAIGQMIADGREVALQALCIGQFEVFAAVR